MRRTACRSSASPGWMPLRLAASSGTPPRHPGDNDRESPTGSPVLRSGPRRRFRPAVGGAPRTAGRPGGDCSTRCRWAPLPEADAVVFPQLLGEAYRQGEAFQALAAADPARHLRVRHAVDVGLGDRRVSAVRGRGHDRPVQPGADAQDRGRPGRQARAAADASSSSTRTTRAKAFKPRSSNGSTGGKTSAPSGCSDKFGVSIVKRSFRELGARAKAHPGPAGRRRRWRGWDVPVRRALRPARRSAAKLYLAVSDDLDADPAIRAVGINCLNESHFSDTTPCLAWNMLFQRARPDLGLRGRHAGDAHQVPAAPVARRADHDDQPVSVPAGQRGPEARTDRELSRRSSEPENHILVAHCGYLGVVPQPFATEWTLRKKVLAIVDENAVAIDARLPIGDDHPGQAAAHDGSAEHDAKASWPATRSSPARTASTAACSGSATGGSSCSGSVRTITCCYGHHGRHRLLARSSDWQSRNCREPCEWSTYGVQVFGR